MAKEWLSQGNRHRLRRFETGEKMKVVREMAMEDSRYC